MRGQLLEALRDFQEKNVDRPLSHSSNRTPNRSLSSFLRPLLSRTEPCLSLSHRFRFIYLFIGVGAILFLISCFGCIASVTRNGCCLSCYSFLVVLLILVELGCAAFIFSDKNWKEEIPSDKTGNFDTLYGFLRENWTIVKWVALGIVVFEALLFILALIVRAANRPADYDSDEEFINPRQQSRQPLLNNRPAGPAPGVPATGTVDARSSRNDAWSTRMREKVFNDPTALTEEELYDLRDRWATCFLQLYNPEVDYDDADEKD
ncbi:unnamed protein product [Trifolium pratense]|uniref:Uncharacterized protein n=1 Tax=Trifolium pratense TaxID=57577 RepID=A0ACB0L401_TRIPR|nr:unnamed protein product [Trifolium pratense]